MCGLFGGISSHLVRSEVQQICSLGVLSSLRGMDSSGIAVVKNQEDDEGTLVLKGLGPSSVLLASEEADVLLNQGRPCKVIAGHCRLATIGSVRLDNAHPFKYKHITGMHNGTIHALRNGSDTSDSENLFKLIADEGIREAIDKAGSGEYAIVYINDDDNTINFLRNSGRSIFGMYTNSKNTLYWASEAIMLKFIAEREGNNWFGTPFLLKPDILFTMSLRNMSASMQHMAPSTKKVQMITHQPRAESRAEGEILRDGKSWMTDETIVYRGFKKKKLRVEKLRRLLSLGCSICKSKKQPWEKIFWFGNMAWLCDDCRDSFMAKNYVNQKYVYEGEFELLDEGNGVTCG